jgi:membrane protease YdiL (CAAX protease family)
MRGSVGASVFGFLGAVVCMWLLVRWVSSPGYYDGHIVLLLSYAVVWVPLLAACGVACFVLGSRSPRRDFGLTFTWLDALFGIGIGLLARAVASIVEIQFYGQLNGLGVTFGEVVYDGWWVFGALLAPILLAPFVEELYFRGLAQRTAFRLASIAMRNAVAMGTSILISALLFTALHLAEVTNLTAALVLGISTFIFGLGSATLAALTGRIGGSIIAHAVFNGSLILSTLLV